MAASLARINVPGPCQIFPGVGASDSLVFLGYSENGVRIRLDGAFDDVYTDFGGPRKPVDSQFMGEDAMISMSLNFFNGILEINTGGIKFVMDERCKIARRDFESAKEAPDGGIDKKKVTDPDTKQSYQPYGHFIDLTRYLRQHRFDLSELVRR